MNEWMPLNIYNRRIPFADLFTTIHSSFKMELKHIYRLDREELVAELDSRGVTNLESMNVDSLRKMLRKFLKMESEGAQFSPKKSEDIKGDLGALSGKFELVVKTIEGLDESGLKKFSQKGEAKIVHIRERLLCLKKAGQIDEDTLREIERLLTDAETVLETLKTASSSRIPDKTSESEANTSDESAYDEHSTSDPTDLSSPSSDERRKGSPRLPNRQKGARKRRSKRKPSRRVLYWSDSECDQTYFKRTPVSNWNLKFSGEDLNSMSIRRFFIEVHDFRVANRMSKNELMREAKFLFKGSALEVFRSCRRSFKTWGELEERMTLAFTDPSYEKRLKREILDRKQGEDEPVVVYLSKMDNLFHLLTQPLSKKEKLEIIEDNILPEYQMAISLASYRNLKGLERLLIKLETSRARALSSKASVKKGSVEPSLQHFQPGSKGKPQSENVVSVVEATPPAKPSTPEVPTKEKTNAGPKTRIYCYGCKKPGVTKFKCPDCAPGSGNGQSGKNALGVLPEAKTNPESQSKSS